MVGFYLPEGVVVVLLAPRGRIKKRKDFHLSFSVPTQEGCNIFGFMRLQRPFRYIWFLIGSILLSHFVAIGG